jgi:hypothetical protein
MVGVALITLIMDVVELILILMVVELILILVDLVGGRDTALQGIVKKVGAKIAQIPLQTRFLG